MFYTIYKITNRLDGKIYIGKHQTKDLNDGYMGSGKHLKYAQTKYGIDNFEKEILFKFDNEADMNAKEAELVTEEFCLREDTYNLCPGGKGGWGYLNSNGLNNASKNWFEISQKLSNKRIGIKRPDVSDKLKTAYSEGLKIPTGAFSSEGVKEMSKRALSPEANIKRSATMKTKTGDKNSQFGTIWITDGVQNKKIPKTENIPEGWFKGRKINVTKRLL
jgi:hypothetical protein